MRALARMLGALWLLSAGCSVLVESRLAGDSDGQGSPDGGPDATLTGEGGPGGGADGGGAVDGEAGGSGGGDASTGGTNGADGGTGEAGGPGGDDGGPGGADGGEDAGGDLAARQRLTGCTGAFHGCVLDHQGRLQCFGSNSYEQTEVPAGSYASVACGDEHTCAIHDDGELECWGSNSGGQRVARTAAGEGRVFVQVVAGERHTCARDDLGDVRCWGADDYGQSTPPEGMRFASLTGSVNGNCGLRRSDSRAECWGNAAGNRLNAPDEPFDTISLGRDYGCAKRPDGAVTCWGRSDVSGLTALEGGELVTADLLVCVHRGTEVLCDGFGGDGVSVGDLYFGSDWAAFFGGRNHVCGVPLQGAMRCEAVTDQATSLSAKTVELPD